MRAPDPAGPFIIDRLDLTSSMTEPDAPTTAEPEECAQPRRPLCIIDRLSN